ncbi:uncharacterized protein LOC124935423 [Impatiens glandulifera]|uniref:uncharacterized protein LOC124935423 n=1 Tax=Impatiens glandulifera TaxID=253017 RepID=UPI001FB0DDD8|nr:uncharacterized protein LOC124935423 [Impatiens glandulifera]
MEFLRDVRLLVSSGGLLFCRTSQRRPNHVEPFVVINPATGMKVEVSEPSGLSRGEKDNNLKVVFSHHNNGDPFLMIIMIDIDGWDAIYKLMVYSFEEKKWRGKSQRGIDIGERNLFVENHVFFDDCICFLSDFYGGFTRKSEYYFPFILCYNIEEEKTQYLRLPRNANKGRNHSTCRMKIFSWDKCETTTMCLVKFCKGQFTIWVWNKEGEKQEWVQILRKTLSDIGILEHVDVVGFTVMNEKTLVIVMENKKVYSYNLVSDGVKQKTATLISNNHGCNGWNFIMYSYSNTLAQIPNAVPIFYQA